MCATALNQFEPDYAVVPGEILVEYLQARGMSRAELSRRCGCSPKLVSEIVSGKASIKPMMATRLETVLRVKASIWLGIQARYDIFVARQAEEARWEKSVGWIKTSRLGN